MRQMDGSLASEQINFTPSKGIVPLEKTLATPFFILPISKQVHEFGIRGDGEVHTKVRIEEKEEKTEGIYNH